MTSPDLTNAPVAEWPWVWNMHTVQMTTYVWPYSIPEWQYTLSGPGKLWYKTVVFIQAHSGV